MMATSHPSHTVRATTFSVGVTENTSTSAAGTATPATRAPRISRGYSRLNRS